VRNDLHGRTEIIAAPFLADHGLVDLAGGDGIAPGQTGVDEAFVVAEIEVGLGTVIEHVDLTMLIRAHRARVDIDVGIELHHGDAEAAGLEDGAERRRRDALAQRGHHTAGYENQGSHDTPDQWKAAFYRMTPGLAPEPRWRKAGKPPP
jgi:hypothetical protein